MKHRHKLCLVALVALAGLALLSRLVAGPVLTAMAQSWNVQTADSGILAGEVDIWVDNSGNARLFYFDANSRTVKSARPVGGGWIIETLGQPLDVPQGHGPVIALDRFGTPHLAFASLNSELTYARLENNFWLTQPVGAPGGRWDLAVDANGTPHLVFGDTQCPECGMEGIAIRYARLDQSGWFIQTIAVKINRGIDAAIALDAAGAPHVAITGGLTYHRWIGRAFTLEQVGGGGYEGTVDLVVDQTGTPRLAYGERNAGLALVERTSSGWERQPVDTIRQPGLVLSERPALAVDAAGRPHLIYSFQSTGGGASALRYARREGGQWLNQTVDQTSALAMALALDASGTPHAAYRTANQVRYATPAPAAPTSVGSPAAYVPVVRNATTDPAFGGTWRTGLQVFNLDQASPASVQIRYLRPDGSEARTTPASTIAGGRSQTYFGATLGLDEGFSGSAVVMADRPVAVIVNELSESTGRSASFDGVTRPGRRVYVPVVLRAANGAQTSLEVQNAGSSVLLALPAIHRNVGQQVNVAGGE